MDERPFSKSTLQQFRAQRIIHDRARAIFERPNSPNCVPQGTNVLLDFTCAFDEATGLIEWTIQGRDPRDRGVEGLPAPQYVGERSDH